MVETKTLTEEPQIKLIDFGLAEYFNSNTAESMSQVLGTPYYIAPEVIKGEYNQQCDVWSIGVITYSLLCGYPPFNGDSEEELYEQILSGKFFFHKSKLAKVTN